MKETQANQTSIHTKHKQINKQTNQSNNPIRKIPSHNKYWPSYTQFKFNLGYINKSRDEVTGEWGRVRNEELNDLYSSPNIVRVIKSRRMRLVGHVAHMGEDRGVYRVLVVKPEGKRPLGRPRRRWVDNIRMDLQEVGCGYMDWIGLAQDRDR